MYNSLLRALRGKKGIRAHSKPRRRAALQWSFDALEDRTVLSQLSVVSANGIGGDNIFLGGSLNFFSDNKIGSTAIDSQGDIYVAGEFAGSINFDPQGSSQWVRSTPFGFDMYVAKYSPQGAPIWVDQFQDGSDGFSAFPTDFANGLAVDSSGNVYVTGSFSDGVNFNPNPGLSKVVFPWSQDVFVLKLATNGTFQNVGDYGNDGFFAGFGEGTSIAVDLSGNNVLVVGDFTNTIDFDPNSGTNSGLLTSRVANVQDGFAVELNSSLSYNWAVSLSDGIGFPSGITSGAFDPKNDNAYVAGFFGVDVSGDTDAIIGRIGTLGNVQQVQEIGDQETPLSPGFQFDAVTGIAVDSNENVYVTGDFAGKGVNFNDLGSGTIALDSSDGGFVDDAFVAKYDKNFNLQWADRLGSDGFDQTLSDGLSIDSGNDVYFGGTFFSQAAYGTNSSAPFVISPVPASVTVFDSYVLRVNASTGNLDSTGGTPDTFVTGSKNGNTTVFDIAGNSAGEVAFTGFYDGGSDPTFGSTTLSSLGETNAFIAELSAPLQPPVINSPTANSTISATAGQSSTQAVSATDPQSLTLSYSLSFGTPSASSWASINPSTGLISLNPPAGAANQSFPITLTVTDSGAPPQSTSENLTISVKSQTPPVVSPISNQTVTAGQSISVTATATGPPGDTFHFNLSNPPSWATIVSTTGVITLAPPINVSGQFSITVTATDNVTSENSNPVSFNVTVNTPAPPVVAPISTQSVTGGQSITVTATATGPAGDTFHFNLSSPPSWATIVSTTGVITLAPPTSVNGSFSLTVTATDNVTSETSNPVSFNVTVNKPAAPVVNPLSSVTVTGGQSQTVTATATGPAGDTFTFALSSPPSWATIVPTTGVITLAPPTSVSGAFIIDVTASDTVTQETSTTPTPLAVTVNKPSAPVVNPLSSVTVTGGQSQTVTATATGPAGDTFTFALSSPPSWATIVPTTGVITLAPPTSVSGAFILNVTASDTVTQETSNPQSLGVTVNKPPPPTVNSIPSVTVTGGQSQTVTTTAIGPPGDTLQYSLINPPSWASIVPTTGVITLAPPTSVSGSFPLTVTATDTITQETSNAQAFGVTVNKPNIPTVNPVPSVTVTGGQSQTVTATATGPAGDASFHFFLNNAPSWASIDPNSGIITVQPPVNVSGQFNMTVIALDNATQEQSTGQSFVATVNKPFIPPQLGAIPTVTVTSGQTQTATATATDVIGDPVLFSLSNAPSWITINPNSGVITVNPPINVGGSASVTVNGTDATNGSLFGTQTFTANVVGVPPQINGFSLAGTSRKGFTGVTIFFNEPMDPNSTGSSGNYTVRISSTAKGKVKKILGAFAQYNGSNNSVFLTFSKKQKFHIQLTIGGIRAANGAGLSSGTLTLR